MSRIGRIGRTAIKGQSLVEFALVVPVLLLITMVAIDFGRVYLGWINLQNMARIAANYAANNPTAWEGTGDPVIQTRYQNQIVGDAGAINCALPETGGDPTAPDPTFTDTGGNGNTWDVGDTASVALNCQFGVVTPIISTVLGNTITVGASAVFPVRTGMIGNGGTGGPGGGGGVPIAAFSADPPTTGENPLTVKFRDESGGNPTSWTWDFGDGSPTSGLQDPTHTYTSEGQFDVTLTATNGVGSSAPVTEVDYITVAAPAGGPDFTGTPTLGNKPLDVEFDGEYSGTATSWAWDFGDGNTGTGEDPDHTYNNVGRYTVTLTVTTAAGPEVVTKEDYIEVRVAVCEVPNFTGLSTEVAQSEWNKAFFTTLVNFKQGNRPWIIQGQSLTGNSFVPCDSVITVSKN